jgi:hypothetical protein
MATNNQPAARKDVNVVKLRTREDNKRGCLAKSEKKLMKCVK